MIGDYTIIRNPVIHSVDEEIPDFVVSKVIKEFHSPKETTFTGEVTYINEDLLKQMLGEK